MPRRKRTRVVIATAEKMEPRLLLTTDSWKTAISGDWDTASNWSLGTVPTASEDVSITVAGSYTVTHSTGNDSCASITSDEPLVLSGGSLAVSGDVQVNNTFTISGGTLSSATVVPGGGGQGITTSGSGGVLTGVTLSANVSIPNDSDINFSTVTLDDDTVSIDSTGSTTGLAVGSGSTINGTGDITFGGSSPADDNIFAINGSPVTFGSGITINGSGGSFNINYEAPAFINDGTIDSSVSGQTMTINGEIDNHGTIEAQNGGNVNIAASWTNESGATMSVSGGGTLTIGLGTTGTGNNAGTITMTNSTLNLGAAFTNTGTISRNGGTVNLIGLYNLNSGSRTLTSSDGSYIMDGGGAENGTLTFSGSGTLVPTTVGGLLYSLTLDSSLTLSNGDLVTTSNLTMGSGTILTVSSTGANTEVIMDGGTFIDGPGSILFAGSDPTDDILFAVNTSPITFGASLTIDGEGGSFNINYETNAFINDGTINSDTANQTMTISGPITNSGTIEATNGGSLTMTSDWTNESSGVMSVTGGGTLTIGPASSSAATGTNSGAISETDSTLNLGGLFTNTGSITRSAGTVNLIGTYNLSGGTLALNPTTGPYVINGGGVENGTITFNSGNRLVPTATGGELANDTLDNPIHITNGTSLDVGDGMTLNSDIILRGATETTTLYFDQNNYAAQTISGHGAVIFAGSNTAEDQISSLNGQGPVTIGSGITIEGNDGRLYLNYEAPAYINKGIIEDDVPGGSLSLPANALTNEGVIEAAPGTITLDDSVDFDDSQGIFTVGIGGTVAGTSYGQIVSTGGVLTFGGVLNTPLLPGFTPTAGQVFTPISYDSANGSFSTTNTIVGGGDAFTVSPGNTTLTLTASTGGADFADIGAGLLTVNGTSNPDTISLSAVHDLTYATLNGSPAVFFSNRITDELVQGNAGNDSISSSISNDTLIGNAGDDTLVTSADDSTLQGAGGNDSIVGASGDSLRGGASNDSLTATGSDNTIVGGGGDDTIIGGSGNNTLAGGPGNDSVVSGSGATLLISGIGTDTLDGGNVTADTLQYSSAGDSLVNVAVGDSVVLV